MARKKHKHSAHPRVLAFVFLGVGLLLLSISLILNVIFIDSDFKREHKEQQYQECINGQTKAVLCEEKFGN